MQTQKHIINITNKQNNNNMYAHGDLHGYIVRMCFAFVLSPFSPTWLFSYARCSPAIGRGSQTLQYYGHVCRSVQIGSWGYSTLGEGAWSAPMCDLDTDSRAMLMFLEIITCKQISTKFAISLCSRACKCQKLFVVVEFAICSSGESAWECMMSCACVFRHWLLPSFVSSFIPLLLLSSFARSFVCFFIRLFVGLLVCWFICLLARWFIGSVGSWVCAFSGWLVGWLVRSFLRFFGASFRSILLDGCLRACLVGWSRVCLCVHTCVCVHILVSREKDMCVKLRLAGFYHEHIAPAMAWVCF